MMYFDYLKMVRKFRGKRADFVRLNNELNKNEDFKKLTSSERFCIKADLYEQFKSSGYKDSKNFSFLIATKPII